MSRRLVLDACTIDLDTSVVTRDGEEVVLTNLEVGVLAYLVAHAPRIVPRSELLVEVWGYRPGVDNRGVVDALLRLLRRKVERPGTPAHILTIRGQGFRFELGSGRFEGDDVWPIGRRRQGTAVLAALLDGGAAVSLVGPPGVGTSTLARAVVDRWRGDAVWVDLEGLSQTDEGLGRLWGALAAPPRAAVTRAAVRDALVARGPLLLALDGHDDWNDLAELVAEWRQAAVSLRVVAAGQRALAGTDLHLVEPLAEADATRVLARHGAQVGDPDCLALVAAAGGLPLALELLARQTRLQTPLQLVSSLGPLPEGPLDVVIRRSHDRLEPGQAALLLELSVASTPVELASLVPRHGVDAAPRLEALLEHQLVARRDDDGIVRFDVLPPVRRWCVRAAASAQLAEARAAWVALAVEPQGPVPVPLLHAALPWAEEADDAARIALRLAETWRARGPWQAARTAMEDVLRRGPSPPLAEALTVEVGALAARTGDVGDAWHRLTALAPTDPRMAAWHALVLGTLRMRTGQPDGAARAWRDAADRYAALGDGVGLAHAVRNLGVLAHRQRDLDSARDFYREALRRGHEDSEGRAITLINLAWLALDLAEPDEAEAAHRAAVDAAEEVGTPQLRARAQLALASLWQARGRVESALAGLESALRLARRSGDADLVCAVLADLGLALWVAAQPERAREAWSEGLWVARTIGGRRRELRALQNLSTLERSIGDRAAADRYARAAHALIDEATDPELVSRSQLQLAEAARDAGDVASWRAHAEAALELALEARDVSIQALAWLELADLRARGGKGDAISALERAEAALSRAGVAWLTSLVSPRIAGLASALRAHTGT